MFVLCEKIYPIRPELVRNDKQTAQIVFSYVQSMSHAYHSIDRTRRGHLTQIQEDALNVYLEIYHLEDTQAETIRKYISKLWAHDAFDGRLEFRKVKL